MHNNLSLIGRAEEIEFPNLMGKPVPARVDTGAKTSSIWASGMKVTNKVLQFKLFDEQSPYYSGELIKTRDFSKRIVSSSTGQVEQRFAVKLSIVLKGRKIKASFTLANRSSQVYPVLIGRNILRGKFIVNVKIGKPLIKKEQQHEINKKYLLNES